MLVWFAVMLGTIIFFVAFVVDIANFYTHKRHLQLQADAGALSTATLWGACLGASDAQRQDVNGTANVALINSARRYGGDPNASGAYTPAGNYNTQIGVTQQKAPPPTGTGSDGNAGVHLLVNSDLAPAGNGPEDYWNHGGTDYSDSAGGSGAPCAKKYVDVKVTESKLDSFFNLALGFLNLIPSINAHARVAVQTLQTSGHGALPIAVPNPKPKSGAVLFINEASGNAIFRSEPLVDLNTTANGLALWATQKLDNFAPPSARVGVVIVLSGLDNVYATITGASTLATICGNELTQCYDSNPSTNPGNGLLFVRGSSNTAVAAGEAPRLRDVQLFTTGVAGACTDQYFATNTATCNVGIEAKVQAAPLVPNTGLQIFTIAGNCPTNGQNTGCALAVDPNQASAECAALQGTGTCWRGTVALPAAAGTATFTMNWNQTVLTVNGQTCTTQNNNPCKANFEGGATIQRSFFANDARSGPIKLAEIHDCDSDPLCGPRSVSTYPINSPTHSISVKIGIEGSLANATSVNDPKVALRVIGGSNNQSLDCDPAINNLAGELYGGCVPKYEVNPGTPVCSQSFISSSQLWATPQPWRCVAVQTGNATNQVPQGLNHRVICDPNPTLYNCQANNGEKPNACPPNVGDLGHNNWSLFDLTKPNDGFPMGDPRIIEVFLTPYGSFSGNGSHPVPVTGFAVFYLTGWTGQGGGFDNPCQAAGSDDVVPGNDPKTIVGHFIKYIGSFSGGGGSGTFCDFNDFAPCIPVLTN